MSLGDHSHGSWRSFLTAVGSIAPHYRDESPSRYDHSTLGSVHEEYTRSEQEVEEEEDTSDEQGSSAEAQSYATMSRVPLDTRPCTSPRPIRREKGG